MADEVKNKTISTTNSGFPDYLNFDKLRRDAVEYIGNLSGKIWTDHNVHDPGITILEVLIYALLDLGYRTNLPAVDLFTRDPEDKTKDNNFFTPAQILGNNPLTITDYRKLLVDIKGVKNAWLEIDELTSPDFCSEEPINPTLSHLNKKTKDPKKVCECDYLNGLYHVYVQLDKDYNLTDPQEKEEHDQIIYCIKCALMQHRNLCEDFIDIKVLCKTDIGLCADIELEPDANGEEIYMEIAEILREFFSPSPKFYTLPQLLDKGKPIDEIFAGRPFNLKESYGFVDISEFEQIELRKKIHLSDVYHILFDIKGIKNVRNLAWKRCSTTNPFMEIKDWELILPENFIPEFSVGCSGFQFFKYGMSIKVNQEKYKSFLQMNFSSHGKILYKQPSPNLDAEMPKGIYRSDLADYYSIQNEFPHVYGIGDGDLATDASDERKAKALQLQGFLLFFDQLLANYLTQLKNIRSLFALSSSEIEGDNHSYFVNQLNNVPQLQKLLRFKTDETGIGAFGSEGTIIAYPTDKKIFEELINNGKIKNTDLEKRCNEDDFPEYKFCYAAVRDQAVNQLRDDLLYGEYEAVIESNSNECFFFYLFTSSVDFVIISKGYYKNEQEARNAAASLKYTASFSNNYRSFVTTDCVNNFQLFSFDIELTLDTYAGYLKVIVEDKNLYLKRRQDFLNHLLSRFAEQFTDYALLSSESLTGASFQKSQIKAEERFLGAYDDLSSNRGRAYNYLCNGWKNENVSGFEKRFKALAGIDDWRKHYLCNFLVEEIDKQYVPEIEIDNKRKLKLHGGLNKADTLSSLHSIYTKLNRDAFFEMIFLEHEDAWQLFTKDEFNNKYIYSELLKTKGEAELQRSLLQDIFTHLPGKEKHIIVAHYIFKVQFMDYTGHVLAEYTGPDKDELSDRPKAEAKSIDLAAEINSNLRDKNTFTAKNEKIELGSLISLNKEKPPFGFINKDSFEFYALEDVNLTDDIKFTYTFRDINKKILFESLTKFSTEILAREAYERILPFLTSALAYSVHPNDKAGFSILVKSGDDNIAAYFNSYTDESAAKNKIMEIIRDVSVYTYTLQVSQPIPDKWKFIFWLMDIDNRKIEYESKGTYPEENLALNAAKRFYADIPNLHVRGSKSGLTIESGNAKIKCIWNGSKENADEINAVKKETDAVLKLHRSLVKNTAIATEEQMDEHLKNWQINKTENYRYKLVDKDNLLAYHTSQAKILLEADALKIRNRLYHQLYDFIDINTGGNDIFCCYEDDKTKIRWYHYQVKCSNRFYTQGRLAGKELVLFQSGKGYLSKEEAQKAFSEEYPLVLKYAHVADNYGDNKFISLAEFVIHVDDPCFKTGSMVFVPKETSEEFGGYEVQKYIIPLVKSYPVKYIAKAVYRFFLYNPDIDYYDWRSVPSYKTSSEAMQQFQFFLVLLKYQGNFYIEADKTDCRFHIYIREVLAESIHGFNTCEDAWGEDGIEKFICVSQTQGGFHNYFKRKDCSHAFFVACDNTGLLHPCKYETPERRDNVLNKLFQAASFNFFDHLQFIADDQLLLLDLNNKPIAKIFSERSENFPPLYCDKLIDFFESIYITENYIEQEPNRFHLIDSKKSKIAEPIDAQITLEEWKRQLLEIGCYFPLYKKDNNAISITAKNECNFYVQIKLPAFDSCENDMAEETGGCKTKEDECIPGCYIAWKTDCCFDTCCDALEFYIRSLELIRNYDNYKRVYECNCGYYGIELHAEEKVPGNSMAFSKTEIASAKILERICDDIKNLDVDHEYNLQGGKINLCLNEIVAVNPQQYTNELMACEAGERAKKRINSEGLHLVEHILLRPRCKNADGIFKECKCEALPKPSIDQENICHFQWKPGGEIDPCDEDKTVCFTPGCDPYSFIATVALPAWPERFRSAENRAVVEKLLQKEAPAHVLLRILWLNPRDFCCFEYYFKLWNEWLAKKLCIEYNNCDFLEFLFMKDFKEISDCKECQPCHCDIDPPVSCFENEEQPCDDFNLLSTLNRLFCWDVYKDHEFSKCEACICKEEFKAPGINGLLKKSSGVKGISKNIKASAIKSVEPAAPLSLIENRGSVPLTREKSKRIQARSNFYNENVKIIADTNPENPVAQKALRFLSDRNPDSKRYDDLVNQVLKNKSDKAKDIKALSLKSKQILIQNITWQYLDRVCFFSNEIDKIREHEFLFNHLRKNRIDMNVLYKGWKSAEVKELEPGTDITEIKRWLV